MTVGRTGAGEHGRTTGNGWGAAGTTAGPPCAERAQHPSPEWQSPGCADVIAWCVADRPSAGACSVVVAVTGRAAVTAVAAVTACGPAGVWVVEPGHMATAMSSIPSTATQSAATGEVAQAPQRLCWARLFITAMLAVPAQIPTDGA